MTEVTFQIENAGEIKLSANGGANLLQIAREANIAIDAPCSGNGACGKCRVKLISGELESLKSGHITDEEYADGWRLACASKLVDGKDVTVFIPDIASAYQSRIRTADISDEKELKVFNALQADMQSVGLGVENPYKCCTVSMNEPSLEDTLPDNERLVNAMAETLGCERVKITRYALSRLSAALRANHFTVTVICEETAHGVKVYDVYPVSDPVSVCGIAIDIGTTTVSGVLTDLSDGRILAKASAGNGQIRYGADVINRIVEQNKEGGRKKLQDAIIKETLIPLVKLMEKQAGVEKGQVMRLTIAGNTTMNHLLMGVYADPVRTEPYIPTFFRCDPFPACDLVPELNPSAVCLIAPNIGSYVGGDITAGAMASMMWNKEEFTLFIDLGTNGEIVFGNSDFLMSCACSAGPAFEGGDISCGMRATDGAIEAVTIDAESMEPDMKIVGAKGQKPVGICGSGIIDIIAELYRCGIIDSKGKFVRRGSRVLRDEHDTGRYVIARKEESETGREISINEVDIESFIRAKGAIYSAIDTMLGTLDMTPDVIDHMLVAGGIGSGINMENAVRIGMFPDVDREKFEYIGNSSLAGAYAMVLSENAYGKVHEIASNMTYLELSTYPGYMDHFIAACFIPHTDLALFPSSKQEYTV